MIRVLENPNTYHNAANLIERQAELAKEFGEQCGHPDPDYGGDADFW
jgi:hypothetical protein